MECFFNYRSERDWTKAGVKEGRKKDELLGSSISRFSLRGTFLKSERINFDIQNILHWNIWKVCQSCTMLFSSLRIVVKDYENRILFTLLFFVFFCLATCLLMCLIICFNHMFWYCILCERAKTAIGWIYSVMDRTEYKRHGDKHLWKTIVVLN